ncbi:MAG: o-succinylbenzoate synthase, partial [Ilumatobacter sp.]
MTELDVLPPVRVERIELRRIAMPLVTPFRTSFGVEADRDILLVNVLGTVGGVAVSGWGECVALADPTYPAEYVDGAQHVTEGHLLPRLTAVPELTAADVGRILAPVHGHPMAKGAIEAAVLDAQLRAAGRSFADLLGVAAADAGS